MAYHTKEIVKGEIGKFSKIKEEIEELLDGAEQDNHVLMICELSDLIGAIESYVEKRYNLTLVDLVKFSNLTKLAFIQGKRK